MYELPCEFKKFIEADCNRLEFIIQYLNERGVKTAVLPVKDKNHIYVKFPQSQYNPSCKIKTILAHYDRVEQSPGANDNSSSVFSLMEWAVNLQKEYAQSFHNIRLIFTDGEEETEGGVKSMGAFDLALLFKKLKIVNDDIIVFDCTGRGTIPVICEPSLPQNAPQNFLSKYSDLEARLQRILVKASGGKWFNLPCKYSDNAGFIANGFPAVAVTFLPSDEVSEVLKNNQCKTWALLHTQKDNLESLSGESFVLMKKILFELAKMKTFLQ